MGEEWASLFQDRNSWWKPKTPKGGNPIKRASRSLKSRKTKYPFIQQSNWKLKKSPRENPNQSDPMKNPNIWNPLSERRATQQNLSL